MFQVLKLTVNMGLVIMGVNRNSKLISHISEGKKAQV